MATMGVWSGLRYRCKSHLEASLACQPESKRRKCMFIHSEAKTAVQLSRVVLSFGEFGKDRNRQT